MPGTLESFAAPTHFILLPLYELGTVIYAIL
jgi:hypothetical protein